MDRGLWLRSNGGRSAYAIEIACASLSFAADGSATVGSAYSRVAMGTGTGGWTPATWTPVAMCPSNAVVTGLDVHTGTNQRLFQNVAITCTALDGSGAANGATTEVQVMDSLDTTQGDSSVSCASGTALRELVAGRRRWHRRGRAGVRRDRLWLAPAGAT